MLPEDITLGILSFTVEHVEDGDFRDKYLEAFTAVRALPFYSEMPYEQISEKWKYNTDKVFDESTSLIDYLNEANKLPSDLKMILFDVCFDMIVGDKTIEIMSDEYLNILMKKLNISTDYVQKRYEEYLSLTQPSFENYFNQNHGFSVDIPNNWEIVEEPEPYVLFLARSPLVNSADDFLENVNLTCEPSNNCSLDEFFNQSNISLQKQFEDFKLEETGDAEINGLPAKYSLRAFSTEEIGDCRQLSVYLIHRNSAYSITCSTRPVYLTNYKSIFDRIILSLRFN